VELVDERDGLIQRQLAGIHLPEELQHHRDLHGAGGMEGAISLQEHRVLRAAEVLVRHGNGRALHLRDALLEGAAEGVRTRRRRGEQEEQSSLEHERAQER
jgi:hypothetical protein